MPSADRQTISSDLLSRLEKLFDADDTPDEFTRRMMLRDVAALTKIDPADASMVKAGLAALAWDRQESLRWIENSLRLERSVGSLLNAGLTFKLLNQLDCAVECVLEAAKLAPLDSVATNRAISYLIWNGRFSEAAAHYQRAIDRGIVLTNEVFDPTEYANAIETLGISQQRVDFELKSAYDVLFKHQRHARSIEAAVAMDPDGGSCLVIEISFFGTLTEEMRMESELAQVLAEAPGWSPCTLATELKYQSAHAHQPA